MKSQKKYFPHTDLEKFAASVFNLLVENFEESYFVGGMVRDFFLEREIKDIDIATKATPDEVSAILLQNNIECDTANKKFGVIIARQSGMKLELATFRKDLYYNGRYPEVNFVATAEEDSVRRDFTVNSLYFKPDSNVVLDFHDGLKDIENKLIRFIGDPVTRIIEDPLRILRAFRFKLSLNFEMESNTIEAIEKNIRLLKKISESRKKNELLKIKSEHDRENILRIIHKFS